MSPISQLSWKEIYRDLSLDLVSFDAQQRWGSLEPAWKIHKEFVLKVLKESPSLPPKWDFEDRFPLSLRNDRDVVLAFANRPDFVKLFEKRNLRCPDNLKGDKWVMFAYCTWIPRSLHECSVRKYLEWTLCCFLIRGKVCWCLLLFYLYFDHRTQR